MIIGGWAIIIDWRLGLVSIALLPALVVGMMFQVFLLVGNITNIIFLVQIKLMMFDGAVQKGALEVQNSIETQKKISHAANPLYVLSVKYFRERASTLFKRSATSELLSGSGFKFVLKKEKY